MGRYVKLGALGVGVALFIWFSAVRNVGEVKARKAVRRGEA